MIRPSNRISIVSFFVAVFSSNIVSALSNPSVLSRAFPLTVSSYSPIDDPNQGLSSDLINGFQSPSNYCDMISKPPPSSIIAYAQYKEALRKCWEAMAEDNSDPNLSGVDDGHEGHSHEETNKGALIGYKLGALALMAITAIAGCIIPLLLHRTKIFVRIMTYVNSFACGAFLGLAFFHLLPESLYLTESARLGFNVGHNWYNLLFPLTFLGFVLILVFEKVLLVGAKQEVAIVGHCGHGHGDHSDCIVNLEGDEFKQLDLDVEDSSVQGKIQEGQLVHVHHQHLQHHHHDHDHQPTSVLDKSEQPQIRNPSISSSLSKHSEVAARHFSALALLATLSLSVHSVFEGIVVGTFDEGMSVFVAALSICGHKWAAGFALGANCVKANVSRSATWIYLTIFILSSPIGVLIGLGVSATNYAFIGAVDAISLGAILYTGCELLFSEFGTSNRVRKELLKFMWLMIGALMVFALYMAHVAGGSHEHGSEHVD